jgi:tubulin epsilon
LVDAKGAAAGTGAASLTRGIDNMFSDAFQSDHQLLKVNPKAGTYLACGLLCRGALQVSDINRNIARLKPSLNLIHWNTDGFKIGTHFTSHLSMSHMSCMTITITIP